MYNTQEKIIIILVQLLITAFAYLIFPISYRHYEGKVTTKLGRKLARRNSIIVCTIFCIIRALITKGETIVTNFIPATTYYFIAKWILIDKTPEAVIQSEDSKTFPKLFFQNYENSPFDDNFYNQNKDKESTNINYCTYCGSQLLKDAKFCSNCGKKLDKK